MLLRPFVRMMLRLIYPIGVYDIESGVSPSRIRVAYGSHVRYVSVEELLELYMDSQSRYIRERDRLKDWKRLDGERLKAAKPDRSRLSGSACQKRFTDRILG